MPSSYWTTHLLWWIPSSAGTMSTRRTSDSRPHDTLYAISPTCSSNHSARNDANNTIQGVLTRGANELNLPLWYQRRLAEQPIYQPKTGWWFRLGVVLFLWPWTRAAIITERLVYKHQGPDGHVPAWFLFIFDCLLWLMWAQHDYIHGPIFGRGDGR